jgi:4-amino-4-deoxy-L-arabinose transferase-like glycosyltransferase
MTAHETQSPLGHTVWRLLAVVLVLLAMVATTAPRALAVEEATPAAGEEQERLTYEELRNSSSQRAQEFFPEDYQEPSFFQWISVPTLIIGLVIAVAFLGAYLWWQPKFAAERREKERR